MIIRILLALFCLTVPAQADIARVRGGEHPLFTRIVVESKSLTEWRLGRQDDSYALQVPPGVSGFNLADAFSRIPRDRLSALWQDTASGGLRFALSCRCHAVAFEFRPGFVVIDIRDGLPPSDSPFEAPLSQASHREVRDVVPPAVPLQVGDAPAEGRVETLSDAGPVPPKALTPQDNTDSAGEIGPLRDALLRQISHGVAQGVVELAQPQHPAPLQLPEAIDTAGFRSGLVPLPGVAIDGTDRPLTAKGAHCLTDSDLDVAGWLPNRAVEELLSVAREGLVGEFDAPVPDAILRATRMHVALGFGAEARQILAFLPGDRQSSLQYLASMGWIIDLDPPERNAFSGMETCDSAAALWAVLADLSLLQASSHPPPSREPILRAFSSLPPHLRRHFGPVLVEAFVVAGEHETARQLRDAVLRAPGTPGPQVTLMDAQYHLAVQDPEQAAALAQEVMTDPRDLAAEAAMALTEAAFAGRQEVPGTLPDQLTALLQAHIGGPREQDLRRAIALAAAMAGDFDLAFSQASLPAVGQRDLWSLAVHRASDDVFLRYALVAGSERAMASDQAGDLGRQMATRLLRLGFPEQAQAWLGAVTAASDEAARLLTAEAEVMLRDAREALRVLAGLTSPEAERLRATATLQLGDAATATLAFERSGDLVASQRAMALAADWQRLSETAASPWQRAAAQAVRAPRTAGASTEQPGAAEQPEASALGPMASGQALITQSEESRAAVAALLDALDAPQ